MADNLIIEWADATWNPIGTYRKDGTLVMPMVATDEELGTPTEDAVVFRTIGHNNFENDGEDVWAMAGWCWEHDHFTEGRGTPLGWLPMPELPEGVGDGR